MTPSLFPWYDIRDLNDEFRRMGPLLGGCLFDGLWLVAGEIQAKGPIFTWQAISKAASSKASVAEDGSNFKHEFGYYEVDGYRLLWMIDYVERGKPLPARDPADNRTTCRILMIMLADDI